MSQTEYANEEQISEFMKQIIEFADCKQQEINTLREENEKLKKENEKLKKENEKLKKENEKLIIQADAETTADMINKLNEEYDKLNEDKLIVENDNELLQSKISKMEECSLTKRLGYYMTYMIENMLQNLTNSDFMIWFGELENTLKYHQDTIDCMEQLGFDIVTESMIDDCWADNWEEFMSYEGYEEGDDEYEEVRDSPWTYLDGYDSFPDYCFDNNLIDCEEYYSMDCNSEYSLYGTVYWIYNSP